MSLLFSWGFKLWWYPWLSEHTADFQAAALTQKALLPLLHLSECCLGFGAGGCSNQKSESLNHCEILFSLPQLHPAPEAAGAGLACPSSARPGVGGQEQQLGPGTHTVLSEAGKPGQPQRKPPLTHTPTLNHASPLSHLANTRAHWRLNSPFLVVCFLWGP